ncbi:hypothetical protein KADA111694_01620 [Kaistella daneshvariae]
MKKLLQNPIETIKILIFILKSEIDLFKKVQNKLH